MRCSKCGAELPQDTSVCPACGYQMDFNDGQQMPPVQIKSWLAPAILSTIFCCIPFGIVSIVFAAKANHAAGGGNFQLAQQAAKKAKTWFWISFVCGILPFVVSSVWTLFYSGYFFDLEADRMLRNETQFTKAQAKVLTDYMGTQWKGQTAVLIIEPQTEDNKFSKARIKALEDGMKAAGINVTTEKLNLPTLGEGEDPAPMEDVLTAKLYNDIFDKYRDANIFVIAAQMPMDDREFARMKCWWFDGKRKRVVLANPNELGRLRPAAVRHGVVGAAIIDKTGSKYDPEKDDAPSDLKAAFDLRFVLVTPANVDEIARANPDTFAK